jgi:hypothetical protein
VASRACITDLAVIRQGFEGDDASRRLRTKNDGAVIYGAVARFTFGLILDALWMNVRSFFSRPWLHPHWACRWQLLALLLRTA